MAELVQCNKNEVRKVTDDNIHQFIKTGVAEGELKFFWKQTVSGN